MKFLAEKSTPHHLLTSEEAEPILKPLLTRLAASIGHGWDAWITDYAGKHIILSARTRANIVFDETVAWAEREFINEPGVKCKRICNSFWMFIGDKIILRFKKFNRDSLPSNIQTKQQMLFGAQLVFPTMEPGTLLNAGYILDDLQRAILHKKITCQLKDKVIWELKLGAEGSATVETMPQATLQSSKRGPRFIAKADTKQSKAKVAKAGKEE